jgi:SAM-dependent methyltransferase
LSIEDKLKWDRRYQNNPIPDRPIDLVVEYAKLAEVGDALDIACGMGRHSKYLASLGFRVDALDISSVALDAIRDFNNITVQEVDFDNYSIDKADFYNLIICTFFLKRELFPEIVKALKRGGIFIYESFVEHPDNEQAPSNSAFLLKEGELRDIFNGELDFIEYREYWSMTMKGNRMRRVSFVGRKSLG